MAVEIKTAGVDDIPGIWQLCCRHFVEFESCELDDFYALCMYRWRDNPARTDAHPFGWIAVDGGKVVGFLGVVPARYKVGDIEVPAASGTSWAIDSEYRAQSMFLYKELMNWSRNFFLVDTTSSEIAGKFHDTFKYGMKKIPVDDFKRRYFWIIKPGSLVSYKLDNMQKKNPLWRFLKHSPLIDIASAAAYIRFYRNRRIAFAGRDMPNMEIRRVEKFTGEFDDLWEQCKGGYGVTVVRRKDFLNWRHLSLPKLAGSAYVLACTHNGRLKGYAAVQTRGYMSSKDGHFILTDVFYDLSDENVFYNLMNAIFEFVRKSGGSMLEVSGFSSSVMNSVGTQNPYVREYPHCTYWFKTLNEDLYQKCVSETWWPSGVDGDASI
jgi:hypothetical protein